MSGTPEDSGVAGGASLRGVTGDHLVRVDLKLCSGEGGGADPFYILFFFLSRNLFDQGWLEKKNKI